MSELIWYHGKITKAEALKRFRQFHPDGSFMVRESETVLNAYALSVGYQNNVYHYRIYQDVNQKFSFEGMSFYTLSEMVSHYQVHKGILVCLLKHPVLPPLTVPQEPNCDPVYVSTNVSPPNDQGYEYPMTWKDL